MTAVSMEGLVASHLDLVERAFAECRPDLERAATLLMGVLQAGNKVLLCGNGGSAADCQHMAAEIVGRFEKERRGLPAIALTTDTSVLTALGNDYGFDSIFARQVEAIARPGDLLWGFSTSGRSPNVLRALAAAEDRGCHTLAFTGTAPNPAMEIAECTVGVPSDVTARVQEVHLLFGHMLCAEIDRRFS